MLALARAGYQHIKSGRGGATIRVKVRNVRTGATLEKTCLGGRVQDIRLDHAEVQYLYHEGDLYTFMNMGPTSSRCSRGHARRRRELPGG